MNEIINKFRGKNIVMDYYIDNSYRIDGTPQYRRICKLDGRVVYDSKLGIEEISSKEFSELQNYAYEKGAYTREVNAYCRYDLHYTFRIV